MIDFVNNNSNSSDNRNPKPVSIVVTPDQLPSLANTTIAIDSNRGQLFRIDRNQFDHIETASVSSIVVTATPAKKKRLTKILRALHLKKSVTKMADKRDSDTDLRKTSELPLALTTGDASKTAEQMPSTSTQISRIAKSTKGRTAALVKKFSLTPKKTNTKDVVSGKKSAIPLRASTSVDTISNAIRLQSKNSNAAAEAAAATTAAAGSSDTPFSLSEMNLVNIDYRQEGVSDGLDVDVQIGQSHSRQNRIGNRFVGMVGASDTGPATSPFNRSWNTSSNLSIRSGLASLNNARSASISGGSSHEKLQITISGKKRATTTTTTTAMMNDTQGSTVAGIQKPKYGSNRSSGGVGGEEAGISGVNDTERRHIERKALAMHVPPKKLNISHDLTLMNTIGVPSIAQATTSIPSYRITSGSIKNVVQSRAGIKTQSTMQSQRTVDISASGVDVEAKPASASTSELLSVTSFDADESVDDHHHHHHLQHQVDNNNKNASSLLTEMIEAEKRTSMTDPSADGHRLAGVMAATDETSANNTTGDKIYVAATTKIGEPSDQPDESASGSDEQGIDFMQTLIQSHGAKMLQSTASDTIEIGDMRSEPSTSGTQPTIQFEVGKQVRPIGTSNPNLHHTTYTVHDNEPTTTFTSIVSSSTMSFNDTHNNELHTHDIASGGEEAMAGSGVGDANEPNISTENHIHLQFQPNRLQKAHGRRRIAYLDAPADGK